MAPDYFGSCLGYFLRAHKTAVTVLDKLLYFKGNLASLALCRPTQTLWWAPFFFALNLLYLLKGQWLGLVPQLGHQLPNH